MALAICLKGIFNHDLCTPDEPRVAAIPLEVNRNGNLIIPYLAGEPFIEKPPLHFALAAVLTHPWRNHWKYLGYQAVIGAYGHRYPGSDVSSSKTPRRHDACPAGSDYSGNHIPGFTNKFHRIRVDPSLAFFVAASIWCFGEVYIADRRWHCLPAGLFTAAAFLVKGFIGPVLIGMGWLGLAISWLIKRIRGEGKPY
ncbi:MAG: hypothetical protein PVJ06_13755 [Desulfobacterales bacterium]